MSLTGPKLDYARIRNAQRKTHKSIYELKDSTNVHINESSRSEIQELGTNPSDKKAPPVRKEEKGPQAEDFGSVFGQNFCNGNLEYLTSLISDNKAVGSSLNPKNRSNAKGRSHLRAKSTLMGSSNKPQADHSNNENVEPATSVPNTQNVVNTACGTTQASSLKPDIDYESTIFQIEIEKEPTPRHHNFSQRNPNNTPAIKEDRLFDNFFKKGGLMRRSMSLEDLRFEKRLGGHIINEEKSPCQSPKEFKIGTVEKSPEPSHRPDASFGVKGDFMASLNNYIHYFDKSENTSQRTKQKLANQYFVQDTRAGQFLKKELDAAQNEVKNLKRHMDGLQAKIHDLAKMNKHLIKELSEVKGREDEYQQRMQGIEGQFFQLNQRKEHYKAKYVQTQELLEMERADNENNLVVLKKLFANNINHALDPKMTGFHSHTREKIGKEKDQLKMLLKEVLQQKTNKDVTGTLNRMKDKRTPSHIFNNNRYDPQYNMKLNKTKDMMKYNISTISHKAGLRSEEEDYLQDENIDASESSARYGNMDETEEDTYQEPYSPDEKQLSKEQYIRLLQDKLVELSGAQNVNPFTYEKGVNHQRNMNKSKHKVSDTSIPNYFGMREKERKLGYQKSSNHILRFDHPLKYKNRNELDIDGPMDGVNNFRSQNDSD